MPKKIYEKPKRGRHKVANKGKKQLTPRGRKVLRKK